MSSNLRRKTTSVQFNVPQIVDQVKIYNISPTGPPGSVRYTAPTETELKPQLYRGDISLNDIDRSPATIYYWSLPASFAGDKVTSYGGSLRYLLKNVLSSPDQRFRNSAADVQLISVSTFFLIMAPYGLCIGHKQKLFYYTNLLVQLSYCNYNSFYIYNM